MHPPRFLGAVPAGSIRTADSQLKNLGSSRLRIVGCKSSCAHGVSEFPLAEIAPHGLATIHFVVKTGESRGLGAGHLTLYLDNNENTTLGAIKLPYYYFSKGQNDATNSIE
jgi:hypothetical protein